MSQLIVVLNPQSGNGKAVAFWRDNIDGFEKFFKKMDSNLPLSKDWKVLLTDKEGQWKLQLQLLLAQVKTLIVCVGGDGTLAQAVEVASCNENTTFFCVPCGRGNDFVRGFAEYCGKSSEFIGWATARRWEVCTVDLGILRYGIGLEKETKLLNVASIGYGGHVVEQTHHSKGGLSGTRLAYVAEGIFSFFKFQEVSAKIKVNGRRFFDGKIFGLFLCNGLSNGDGLYWSPNGAFDDGAIDLVLFSKPTAGSFLLALKSLKKKESLPFPHKVAKANDIEILFDVPVPIEIDGEYKSETMALKLTVEPSKIKFFKPVLRSP